MTGWTVILGHAAQKDLWTFPWERDVEVGGVCMGRFENSGIDRRDTGRHVFIRRIFASDRGGTDGAVDIDYDRVRGLQTIEVRGWRGRPGGRLGCRRPRHHRRLHS